MSKRELKPEVKTDPLYQLLRHEDVDSFNKQRDKMDNSQLSGGDYRGRDLRKMNARGLDFSNAYFRNCDLSGIDFRETNLEGASLLDSKVSGVYFPDELNPDEIRLSLDYGTRLRCHR
jgi:uncharacterized protein YjbI with pentapeptide repeats